MPDFYTYLWLREDGSPYYVGKGCGNRAYRKGCPPCERISTQEWPDETAAFAYEMYQIDFGGRKDLGTGILRNMTDGGEGAAGARRTLETRLKMSKAFRGRKLVLSKEDRLKRKVIGRLVGLRNAQNKTGACGRSAEKMSEDGRKSGRIGGCVQGRKNVESGHIQALGHIWGPKAVESGQLASLRTPEHQQRAGRAGGRKNVETGHLAQLRTPEHQAKAGRIGGKIGGRKGSLTVNHNRWHIARDIVNPKCSLCVGETVTQYISKAVAACQSS